MLGIDSMYQRHGQYVHDLSCTVCLVGAGPRSMRRALFGLGFMVYGFGCGDWGLRVGGLGLKCEA